MGFFKKLVGAVSGVLNVVAPFASFIPGIGQAISVASVVANVANGLMQKPPQWGQILANVATSLVPMGFGKALGSFAKAFPNGGTALNFAEHLSGRMGDTLKDISAKVMKASPELGGKFAELADTMGAKFASPEYVQKFAGIVSKATGTEPGAILSTDQIARAGDTIMSQVGDLTGNYGMELGNHYAYGDSSFDPFTKPPVVIPPPVI